MRPVMKDTQTSGSYDPDEAASSEEPVVVPIEDFLDLHTFQPREVKDLLDDYLQAACEKGFGEVRIIHGKGTGVLRERVLSILSRHPLVAGVRAAGPEEGGWGATIAILQSDPVPQRN
jgi:dsDNA-specific endonuclease/ATPase MutS2